MADRDQSRSPVLTSTQGDETADEAELEEEAVEEKKKKTKKARGRKAEQEEEEDDADDNEMRALKLRGASFVDAYGDKQDKKLLRRLPTMLKGRKDSTLIPRPKVDEPPKLLCVFDLDETIVFSRDGPLLLRPKAKELLLALEGITEIAFWTAGTRDYAKAVCAEVEKAVWGKAAAGVVKHLVSRNKKWFDEADYTKDLAQLGRDLEHVLIVENTPDCVRMNPKNAIIVEDFDHTIAKDSTLDSLKEVILELIESKLPVPKFIPKCKKLEKQNVDGLDVYYLPAGRKGGQKVVKENRDKRKRVEDSADEETEEEEAPKPKKKSAGKPAAKKAARKAGGKKSKG